MPRPSTRRPETPDEMIRHFMIRDLLTELFDIAIPPAPFSCRMFIGPDVTAFGVDQEQERDRQLEVTELTTLTKLLSGDSRPRSKESSASP